MVKLCNLGLDFLQKIDRHFLYFLDKTYKELTAENAELEKKLSSASKESVRKKLEISQKLNELDELRRTVDAIPDEVIRAYTAQKYVHHGRMNQEI